MTRPTLHVNIKTSGYKLHGILKENEDFTNNALKTSWHRKDFKLNIFKQFSTCTRI